MNVTDQAIGYTQDVERYTLSAPGAKIVPSIALTIKSTLASGLGQVLARP